MEMIANPDVVIEHQLEFCNHCGDDLFDQLALFMLRRQVVDIPPIIPEFTEHGIFQKTCPCGYHTKALFPSRVNSPTSYESNIQATIAYMHTRQYLSFERMSELFRDVCNIHFGIINNALKITEEPNYLTEP
ncbi:MULTISPECIES: IS66 family transposase zinc-finger binding domain-containing protein [unclassified Flavobacterium]|uniref:IS66 family transposase zinc-finger binding domain-containing protein n=1 Tax=unclassified Flavobacterium TaxID=196869 RepID=UPI000F841388|nr:hypothetical protein EKM03_10770 [Flavobacterium sp. GSP6]